MMNEMELGDPYLFTEIGSTWKGYSDNGSTSSLIKAAGVDIPTVLQI